MKHYVIYVGPSLGESKSIIKDKKHECIFEFRPPARAGDIMNLIIDRPSVDVIILADGFFYENYSPMHREIIYAINSGIRVIGCSSMGAIRAVELESYGMIGKGEVFEYFKNYPETSDDEVGLIHEKNYPYTPITIPLINLRVLVSKLDKTVEKNAVIRSIKYLSEIGFDKRFLNTDYHRQNSITQEQKKDLELAMTIYKDFKTNDLSETIADIIRNQNDKDYQRINSFSEINSLHGYIETGRYQTHQYIMAPHRTVCKNNHDEISEVDLRDLLAIGHHNYNQLLALAAMRKVLLEKAMEQHFMIKKIDLEKLKKSLLVQYDLSDELELGSRLKLTQFELKAFLYKEVLIQKMIKAELTSQQSVHCIGNITDTLRVSGKYPQQDLLGNMLFEAKEILKKINKILDRNVLAKLAKNKTLLKGTSINKLRLPTLEMIAEENQSQITKRNEIIEALARLFKPIK